MRVVKKKVKQIIRKLARYQFRYWATGVVVAFLAGLGMEKTRMGYHVISQLVRVVEKLFHF